MTEKTLRVLFVGNSYTYYYDMPKTLFSDMAAAAGYEVEVTQITSGGYFLYQFADPEDAEGKRLRAAVDGKHFDCAVLQEQSMNPITDEALFFQGVRDVMALIPAGRFVLYATWGRNDGSPDLEKLGLTREEMTERLSAAYHKAARLYGGCVAEVGKAFLAYPNKDELYISDMSHPSEAGSAIAARVIFESLRDCVP